MFRKLMGLTLAVAFAFCIVTAGCAENEYKVTDKKETQIESEPEFVSPGEPIVE